MRLTLTAQSLFSFLSERFQDRLDAAHAAAALGLETAALLAEIDKNPSLQNLGLASLLIDDRNMKRDAWTSNFEEIVSCLYGDDCVGYPIHPFPR